MRAVETPTGWIIEVDRKLEQGLKRAAAVFGFDASEYIRFSAWSCCALEKATQWETYVFPDRAAAEAAAVRVCELTGQHGAALRFLDSDGSDRMEVFTHVTDEEEAEIRAAAATAQNLRIARQERRVHRLALAGGAK